MILCAVDDSEAAGRVFATARGLADASAADLDVVHVVEDFEPDADHFVAVARTRLSRDGPAPEVRLLRGAPAQALLEAAQGAELLVVGSRGRGPLQAAVLGSVSRELAARAPCPVVIVSAADPDAQTAPRPDAEESVVCGVDGSDQALAAAALAGRLATRLGCRLVIVHARQNLRAAANYPGASSATPPVSGQEDSTQQLVSQVIEDAERAAGVSAFDVVEPGPPTEVLQSVGERENARLIVIAARGIGAVRAAVLGSVAAELPIAAARPVVVLSGTAAAAAVRSGT